MNTFTEGQKVISKEKTGEIGTVSQVLDNGLLIIEWVYPPSPSMPYGHINRELWQGSDLNLLSVAQ